MGLYSFCAILFCLGLAANSEDLHSNNDGSQSDKELVFVETLWRHGDRSALNDLYPIYEKDWIFGGTELGELTPLGMDQMNRLGGILRKKYMTKSRFLGKKYNSNEVFVRSSDYNRTIISAMSLLYGFYPPGPWNVKGIDYPKTPRWQTGLTFVPVHVDQATNCVTNAGCVCQRYQELRAMIIASLPEFSTYMSSYAAFLGGVLQNYNVTSGSSSFLFEFPDSLKCIRNHFNTTLYQKCPWYNEQFYQQSQQYIGGLQKMTAGNFQNNSTLNGIDIGREIRILQGGPIINEILDRAAQKLDCLKNNCTGYLEHLKFYAYSSHDSNLYALLVMLGIPQITDSTDAFPQVAAAILFEFYKSKTTSNNYVKVLYRKNADANEFSTVTQLIPGCDGQEFCPIEVLQAIATDFKPVPDYRTLCDTSLTSATTAPTTA